MVGTVRITYVSTLTEVISTLNVSTIEVSWLTFLIKRSRISAANVSLKLSAYTFVIKTSSY